MPKLVFWHHRYLALRSRLKVGVKVEVKVKFWRAAVDIRGLALPSATKSNNCKFGAKRSHYQPTVFVCLRR